MSHLAESNCGPRLYERRALPTELRWRDIAVSENRLPRSQVVLYFVNSIHKTLPILTQKQEVVFGAVSENRTHGLCLTKTVLYH